MQVVKLNKKIHKQPLLIGMPNLNYEHFGVHKSGLEWFANRVNDTNMLGNWFWCGLKWQGCV